MIILTNKDPFGPKENKMVYSETPEDFDDSNQKESFQYHVPRVRALFSIKVAPDSTTADLPELALESTNSSETTNSYNSSLLPGQASLPEHSLVQPVVNSESLVNKDNDSQLHVPKPSVISKSIKSSKPVVANGSTLHVANDDKDFEIPLEESLKAVEDFIKREKELSKWNVGEDVLAKWKGNGLYYKARILDIFPSGIIVVLFDSYDITEEIDYTELSKFFKKTSNYKKKGKTHEKPKEAAKSKQMVDAEKHIIARKPRIPYKKHYGSSHFKKTNIQQKRILHNYQNKSPKVLRIKLRTKARKSNGIKKNIVNS